jgi:hypothetical protein
MSRKLPWEEAENLANSNLLSSFCEAQRAFIENGDAAEALDDLSRALAHEARRRRLLPEVILLAMHIAGCYRLHASLADEVQAARYMRSLDLLLRCYFAEVAATQPSHALVH